MYNSDWHCNGHTDNQLTWFVGNIKQKDAVSVVRCKGYCPVEGESKAKQYAVVDVIIDDFGEIIDRQQVQRGSWSSAGCFITTAVCESLGKPDDCFELQVLRAFRDNYLLTTKTGSDLVDEYYRLAPQIVEKMKHSRDCDEICVNLYTEYIAPIVDHIQKGQHATAIWLYQAMVQELADRYQIPRSNSLVTTANKSHHLPEESTHRDTGNSGADPNTLVSAT